MSEAAPLLPKRDTPLPKLQLAILCLVRLAEPVAYTQVFPYVNRMMEVLHVTDDPAQIGFYSGLVDSVFALAQLTMIYRWGRLSDRIGRKPCILMGITGAACSTLLFGLSSSLWTALLARTLAGFLSGNIAIIQSMVGEMTDETNQARAYTVVELIWYIGSIVGTLLGGTLAEPCERFPELFGGVQLFRSYPFLLPCAIAFSMALLGVVLGYFFLEETLPSARKAQGLPPLYDAIPSSIESDAPAKPAAASEPPSVWSLITDPVIISVLRPYFLLSIQGTGFEVVFILFSYTAIHLGGLSRNPAEIGVALAGGGLIAVCSHPIVFPWLSQRIPRRKLYCYLMMLFPVCYLALPMLNVVAREFRVGEEDVLTPQGRIVVWILIGLMLLVVRMAGMAYSAHTIFVKHAAPSREALGSTFGIAQTVGSTARGVAPALVSSLFAITASRNLLGGWFVWLFMALVGVASIYAASRARDGIAERERGIPRR